MKRILVVGFGSIGRRHARLLREIGVEVALLRRSVIDACSGFTVFDDPVLSLGFRPDGVVVCNPTSMHVDTALFFSELGIPTLIEKPISDDSNAPDRLLANEDLLRVGYVMRFSRLHELLNVVRSREQVFKMVFRRSFYLPKWHPYADYRNEYVAKRALGGGCARTLSHEIDLTLSLFGSPNSVFGFLDKLSDLEMDCDDSAFISLRYAAGPRIDIDLDLFSPTNIFEGLVHTCRGSYDWNLNEAGFQPRAGGERQVIAKFESTMLEQAYRMQLEDFLRFIETGHSRNSTVRDGIEVLKIIDALENYAT